MTTIDGSINIIFSHTAVLDTSVNLLTNKVASHDASLNAIFAPGWVTSERLAANLVLPTGSTVASSPPLDASDNRVATAAFVKQNIANLIGNALWKNWLQLLIMMLVLHIIQVNLFMHCNKM
jgi:hypothetical protein